MSSKRGMSPRERIKFESIKLFREKGYERTTVRDIANQVGIQSGSLFHHFASKEAILKEAFGDAIEHTREQMRAQVAASTTVEEALLGLIQCELEAVAGEQSGAVGLLIYEWRSLSEQSQQEMLQLRSDYEQIWQSVLASAYQEGKCKLEPNLMRKLLMGALGWTHTWFKPSGPSPLSEIAEQVLSLMVTTEGDSAKSESPVSQVSAESAESAKSAESEVRSRKSTENTENDKRATKRASLC